LSETVGSDPLLSAGDEAADEVADGDVSDEFISSAPKAASATRDSAKIEAIIRRGFFMGCTLSFTFASPVLDSR
jgi:hypothetical protein